MPATREATLVHMADNLGGRLGSFDRLEKELRDGERWSGFDRALGGGAFFGGPRRSRTSRSRSTSPSKRRRSRREVNSLAARRGGPQDFLITVLSSVVSRFVTRGTASAKSDVGFWHAGQVSKTRTTSSTPRIGVFSPIAS